MTINGYKKVFVKIISSIISAIIFSMYGSWKIYTPVSERLSDIEYQSYSGLFAFNFVPNFFIFIILGAILSPMMDNIIFKTFNLNGIKGVLPIVGAYILLGIFNGIIISILFRHDYSIYYILVSVLGALIFLFFQMVFQFVLFGKRK